jgi:phenylpropionate dioxygenase-like ring-hydroxylating dioxygenase large terminal subunit
MNAPASYHETRIMTQLPDMGTGLVPLEAYISPEYFQQEKEKIFKQAWINVGRVSSHIPNPGDYMVRQLDFLNAPILIVHGRDGVIRAFYNVCTHRGNSVASGSGNARSAFVCGFHGWAFGLDGSLKTVPSEEQFPGLDRKQYGLPPITTEVWRGWIFIHAQEKPDTTLVEFLGGWGKQMEAVPFEDFELVGRYDVRLRCNWKVYVDAFQEAYHVGIVHAESVQDLANDAEVFIPSSLRTYGGHRSLSVWVDINKHKVAPAEALAHKYGGSITPGKSGGVPAGANPSNDEKWWFDINVCFPNFFVDVGIGFMFTYNFFPVSENETFWEVNIYQTRAESAGQKLAQGYTAISLRDLLYEDLSTMEGVQRGLESGALKGMILGDFEVACRHQHWAVEQWLKGNRV